MIIQEFQLLDFGYITGNDLLQFCPPQLMLKQEDSINGIIERGVLIAYDEIHAALSNRYDINEELSKTTGKNSMLVKITAIYAIKNILGNMSNVSEVVSNFIAWADETVLKIQNRQLNLSILGANTDIYSGVELVESKFKTLG